VRTRRPRGHGVPANPRQCPELASGVTVLTMNLLSCAEAIPQKKTAANNNQQSEQLLTTMMFALHALVFDLV